MKLGARHLADCGSIKSRHDFTQRQLMSSLILKTYLKTTNRGVIDWLEGHSGLRRVLGLQHKLPHYTALQKFSARKDVQAALKAVAKKGGVQQATELALDATWLKPHGTSAHYVSRAGRQKSRHIESFFSGMKRLCGAALSARREIYQRQQTALRVLAYALHRQGAFHPLIFSTGQVTLEPAWILERMEADGYSASIANRSYFCAFQKVASMARSEAWGPLK